MLWWQWLVLIITVIMVSAALYSAITYTSATLEVQASPREPMLICDKHGIYREAHAMKFLEQKMCPMCFNEKMHTPLDGSVIPQ